MQQAEKVVEQLRRAAEPHPVDPALPLELARVRREIDAAFSGTHGTISLWSDVSSIGLVGAGLSAVARLLKK